MVNLLNGLCITYVIFTILLIIFSTFANAEESMFKKPLQIQDVWVEYREIQFLRDPYYPDEKDQEWTRSAEFHWNTTILKYMYWDNNFHFRMDESQVRHVGWEYYLGLHVTDWMDVVKYHHSQHCAECQMERRFPVEDSYGVRFYFKKWD